MRTEQCAFDKHTTHFFKGLCAIIVVMVHFPACKANALQDCIGSFAYVAVTFFFFVSAYGMQYSVEKNPEYLRRFWKGRLSALLVPMLIVNLFSYAYTCIDPKPGDSAIRSLLALNPYVKVLLEYCVVFYVLNIIRVKKNLSQKWIDFILIMIIVASSLYFYWVTRQTSDLVLEWPYERLGLVWGLLAYRFRDRIIVWMTHKNASKLFLSSIIGVVLGLAYLKFKTYPFFGEYLLKITLGFGLISLLFIVASRWRVGNAIGRFLGDISYEIYLIHDVVMMFLNYLFPEMQSGQFILMTYAIVIPLSIFVQCISRPIIKAIKYHSISMPFTLGRSAN